MHVVMKGNKCTNIGANISHICSIHNNCSMLCDLNLKSKCRTTVAYNYEKYEVGMELKSYEVLKLSRRSKSTSESKC